MYKTILNKFAQTPKILFLVDGFGALLSFFLLGIVLVEFEAYFGIPKSTLYILASLPLLFAVYDFICYKIVMKKIGLFLKFIAFFNLAYCFISIGFAVYHYSSITVLGYAYLLVEILILVFLITLEFKITNKVSI